MKIKEEAQCNGWWAVTNRAHRTHKRFLHNWESMQTYHVSSQVHPIECGDLPMVFNQKTPSFHDRSIARNPRFPISGTLQVSCQHTSALVMWGQ